MEAAETIVEAERRALGALCQGTLAGAAFDTAISRLASYRFRVPVHRVVFEILSGLPSREPAAIREQLAARLTNMGFPDFDFPSLFAPHGLTSKQALSVIEGLAMGTP
jgi:hypothetical protein